MRRGWSITALALAAALAGGCASLREATTLPHVSGFSEAAPGVELPRERER